MNRFDSPSKMGVVIVIEFSLRFCKVLHQKIDLNSGPDSIYIFFQPGIMTNLVSKATDVSIQTIFVRRKMKSLSEPGTQDGFWESWTPEVMGKPYRNFQGPIAKKW